MGRYKYILIYVRVHVAYVCLYMYVFNFITSPFVLPLKFGPPVLNTITRLL